MSRRVAEIHIAGQKYKVTSSAEPEELERLSAVVSERVLSSTPPGRTPTPQSLLLAAMSLAHDLEEERARRESLERKMRDWLRRVLVRIDDALEEHVARPPAEH
jgi:cell division protein ZapA